MSLTRYGPTSALPSQNAFGVPKQQISKSVKNVQNSTREHHMAPLPVLSSLSGYYKFVQFVYTSLTTTSLLLPIFKYQWHKVTCGILLSKLEWWCLMFCSVLFESSLTQLHVWREKWASELFTCSHSWSTCVGIWFGMADSKPSYSCWVSSKGMWSLWSRFPAFARVCDVLDPGNINVRGA